MITTQYADKDIELQFIREFAVEGNAIGSCLSSEDRRERIRVAIFTNQRHDKPFHDSGMNYAEAYRKCYGKPIELRRYPRAPVQIPEDEFESDTES